MHQIKNKKKYKDRTVAYGVAVAVLVFLMTYGILSFSDFVPENISNFNSKITSLFQVQEGSANDADEFIDEEENQMNEGMQDNFVREKQVDLIHSNSSISPDRIIITKLNLNTEIHHPSSRDIEVLDEELKKGPLQYPGSGYFNENTNMLIFGHSSHLPVVNNPAYKVFNNLNMLQAGDDIKLRGGGREYVYKVISVVEAKDSEVLIEFSSSRKMITLVTCNNFGAKEDRFIVEAVYFTSYALNL